MSGHNGVHRSGLVHAPIVGACTVGVVTAAAIALVQAQTVHVELLKSLQTER